MNDPYEELQQRYEELQRQYDEMRDLLQQTAQAMEALAKPKRKSRSTAKLTLIKGGLGAIVAGLLWLLRRARSHPVVSGALTACVAGVAAVAVLGPTGPGQSQSPGGLNPIPDATLPAHVHVAAPIPGASRGGSAPGSSAPGHTMSHGQNPRPTPVPSGSSPGSPRPSPHPQPTTPKPTPGHSSPPPAPSPSPSPTHSGKHCVVYINALGITVKVCT